MARGQIWARLLAGRQSVVDMRPVTGTGGGGIDARLFDGIGGLQHALHFRPAGDAEQDLATRAQMRNGGVASPGATARRIQCAIRFSSQISSTYVSPSDARSLTAQFRYRRGARRRAEPAACRRR
jgi:hypothetical protein